MVGRACMLENIHVRLGEHQAMALSNELDSAVSLLDLRLSFGTDVPGR
jgi:hypothetical protein